MSTTSADDQFAAALANEGDACVVGLKSNFDAMLAGIILEMAQWSFDFFNSITGAFMIIWKQTPFLGLIPIWFGFLLKDWIKLDFSRTFAHGIMGDL